MGTDVRDISAEAALGLPDRLRGAGFQIEISCEPHPHRPEIIITRVICRRGCDEQRLGWDPVADKPGECRIGIANAWGWRRSARERRYRFQQDVTAIIESAGGYWPFRA